MLSPEALHGCGSSFPDTFGLLSCIFTIFFPAERMTSESQWFLNTKSSYYPLLKKVLVKMQICKLKRHKETSLATVLARNGQLSYLVLGMGLNSAESQRQTTGGLRAWDWSQ